MIRSGNHAATKVLTAPLTPNTNTKSEELRTNGVGGGEVWEGSCESGMQ